MPKITWAEPPCHVHVRVHSLGKSLTIKNVKNIVSKIWTLLTEPFTMSPNVPNKNSLDFLSDYYFNTKSPVAFTSPSALY